MFLKMLITFLCFYLFVGVVVNALALYLVHRANAKQSRGIKPMPFLGVWVPFCFIPFFVAGVCVSLRREIIGVEHD